MGEAVNRQTVERIFQALADGQVELFHAQFHEDSVINFRDGLLGSAVRGRRLASGMGPAYGW